jgi:hypothetical protein
LSFPLYSESQLSNTRIPVGLGGPTSAGTGFAHEIEKTWSATKARAVQRINLIKRLPDQIAN